MGQKTFEEVLDRFRTIPIPERFDLIVAIANGGIIPAEILRQRLGAEVKTIHINLRDEEQQPKYDEPRLLYPLDFDVSGKNILVVDDRIKSGSTIRLALFLLQNAAKIRTFAVNGKADYALYDEDCFRFPWRL